MYETLEKFMGNNQIDGAEKLSENVIANLPSVAIEWLGPVKPFFDRLAALAASPNVSDKEFIKALEEAQDQLPGLFDKLNVDALDQAFNEAIGTGVLAGAKSRIDQGAK